MKDQLGDRMKLYESFEAKRTLMPGLPIVARLDGKSFSKFTKGLSRPYDKRMSDLMIKTTKFLVEYANANCGYTQSDEISLVWFSEDPKTQPYFGGRIMKMVGELAAKASVFFNRELPNYLPEKADQTPTFDCRVWNVPSLEEATNTFLWREWDATKNSISMAAQHYYSHQELNGINGKEKQELLFQKGVNWNDYPTFFKRGTYVQRQRKMIKFSATELEKLPTKHAARTNPDLEIERNVVETLSLPPLESLFISERIEVLIRGRDFQKVREESNKFFE